LSAANPSVFRSQTTTEKSGRRNMFLSLSAPEPHARSITVDEFVCPQPEPVSNKFEFRPCRPRVTSVMSQVRVKRQRDGGRSTFNTGHI
jgi:hypothetical protein